MAELQPYEALGGDAAGVRIEDALREDYGTAQANFRGFGAWMYRVCYDSNTLGPAGAIAKHRPTWRAALEQASGQSIAWPPPPTRPSVPLEDLAHIRGAMWTARLALPWGPRPGQDDNCLCIDYFECFSPEDQGRIIQAYARERGYTHAPMGPVVDAGYHGQLPATDWRTDAGVYLAAAEQLESAGVHVVHFLRPDRGVAGLDWTVADLDRELGPVFGSAQAQSVMRIVCLGWEPGPKYYYDNAWWVEMCAWMARVFPEALRLIHMVADCDAPVGQDDDVKGITNAQGWANVVPYLHGWLVQNAGYTNSGNPVPSDAFITDFTNQFNPAVRGSLPDRFGHGYAGWPTSSAWGEGRPLRVYAGEYAAYANYWQNWPESESRRLGQLARQAGADGALDGC